jgi:hypothetical protein
MGRVRCGKGKGKGKGKLGWGNCMASGGLRKLVSILQQHNTISLDQSQSGIE